MLKITPDPPAHGTFVLASNDELLKDRAAARRALSHYLPGNTARHPSIDVENAWVHASDLLRCASVSAVEASSNLDGTQRDWVLSVLYLVDMARTQVDLSLSSLTAR